MPRRRKQTTPTQLALDAVINWSLEDIRFFQQVLANLLEPPQLASQELPRGVRGGGYIERKVINGKSYFYHRYIHEGKRRSVYLGKQPAERGARGCGVG
jgi:hypothetical protein